MAVQLPRRISLDSWVLKRLARGDWPEANKTLRTQIDEGQCRVIITGDHLFDYGDCEADDLAMQEADFIDMLNPLWILPGEGIYCREAFSEYLRLTGREPLPPLTPRDTASAAMLQWAQDCDCLPDIRSQCVNLAHNDQDRTFSGKLLAGFRSDGLGIAPSMEERIGMKDRYGSYRASLREQGLSEEHLEQYFRKMWINCLTLPPAKPPKDNLNLLAEKVDFTRMPAWTVRMAVDRTWHRNQTVPKRGDLVDTYHLALLPYVDVFVTEKNLADMIKQAGLKSRALVFSSICEWRDAVSTGIQ